MKELIVVGGGASGLMAALTAAEQGCQVTLLEKMPRCGRKIRITGKGRCNVTTMKSREEILQQIRRNPKFMYSSLSAFDNHDVWNFFTAHGCPLKVERGDRVFPQSDKAQDIVDTLVKEAKHQGVTIHCDTTVTGITCLENGGFAIDTAGGEQWRAETVILCTGGASYPGTGSSGDAYPWLETLGLKVEKPYPALVPLLAKEPWVTTLQGLSLRNVRLTVTDARGKRLYSEQGEMLFTHFGISGPLVLSASGHAAAYWQKKQAPLIAHIDLKPALSEGQLDARLLREIQSMPNKQITSLLKTLLPQKMVLVFLAQTGIDEERVLHHLTKEERQTILGKLKDFSFTLTGTRPLTEGIVTAGGLSVKALDPKTMAVKNIPGLFVAGELIDLDAYTGGFNLQIAFSTGYAAGVAAAHHLNNHKEETL
ncbi:MAG: NAD(P)/FAD-dependent oxidoreductase [Peptococcaceae bacterium]|nr:NAD(P)/FAD-dependent oxidoreductase [Peptococcaceae bacterium]